MKLYAFEILIAQKALSENSNSGEIKTQLCDSLGLTQQAFNLIANAEAVDADPKVTSHLLRIAEFFGCSMDDLINPAYRRSLSLKMQST